MPTERRLAERPARFVCMFVVSFAIGLSTSHATDFCRTDPRVEAVDSSAPVTQSFLDQMKAIGIKAIIRYYDHEDETLPGENPEAERTRRYCDEWSKDGRRLSTQERQIRVFHRVAWPSGRGAEPHARH